MDTPFFRRDIFLFLHKVGGTSEKSVHSTSKIFEKKEKKLSRTGDELYQTKNPENLVKNY
jgi:hypothetical protein